MDIIIRTLYGLLWCGGALLFAFGFSFVFNIFYDKITKHFKHGRKIVFGFGFSVLLVMSYYIGYSAMFNK